MQLRHYAWVIGRSLWLIFLLTGLTAGATYAMTTFVIAPVYQASVLVQVNMAGDSGTVFANQSQAVTYALLVTNTTVLQKSVAELKNVTLGQLKRAVSASPLDNTSIIEIRAQANSPQLAADMANTVALNFISTEVTNVSAALQSNLQQLTPLLATAKDSVTTAQAQLNTLQQTHASTAAIAHQVSVLESAQSNYDTLLLNYEQIQQQLFRVNNILTRVQKALPPDAPISPRANLDTAAAAGLGLLILLVFVLLRDWFDTSIRTSEDVAHLAELEPAGSVPLSKRPVIGVVPGDDGAVAQTFMSMALGLSKQTQGCCALVVTALRPGAGVTTTAANLAISLARTGRRVLLLDANLRHPSLQTIFQTSNQKGLENSLPEFCGLQEEERRSWFSQWATSLPNLWLLPAGPGGAHSTAVLCSPELRVLMRWLLGQSHSSSHDQERTGAGIVDSIIIDAPSLREGADPVALTVFTSHTLLVAEAGKEQGEDLSRAGALFQKLGSPVLGVVVNRQTPGHRPYFYVEHAQDLAAPAENVPASSVTLLTGPASSNGREEAVFPAIEQSKSMPHPYPLASSSVISRPSAALPPGQRPGAGQSF